MIITIAEIIIICIIVDWACRRIKLPGLIGMLLVGLVFGPYLLNMLDPGLIQISKELRMLALIIILLRAGLELSTEVLHRVGTRVLTLAIIPSIAEAGIICLAAPPLLGLSYLESAILGTIVSAVSPAVVITMMVQFIERGIGTKKGIPTMLLSACALNDVIVIVSYSALIGLYTGSQINIAWQLMGIPISILLGISSGVLAGLFLSWIFEKYNPRATKRVLLLIAVALLFVRIEHLLENIIPFAALLAVMASGFVLLEKREHQAHEISARLAKLWVLAEIILFTMVGAQVDIALIFKTGVLGACVILIGLSARAFGTYLCLLKSELNSKERIFVCIAYIPKATVQAAIGGMPLLAMSQAGLNPNPGQLILAISVLSIVLCAPTGAWAIEFFGNRFLEVDTKASNAEREAATESEASKNDLLN